MRKKSIISVCLIVPLLMISACGNAAEAGTDAIIELKEPVWADTGVMTESVIRRNIYVTSVYDASVYPETEEYSFDASQKLDTYGARLGETVESGEVLVYADEESITDRIESFQERLDKLKEDYEEYCKEANETLAEAREYVEYYAEALENMEEIKPDDEQSKDYSKWKSDFDKWQGQYSLYEFNVMTGEEELRQKTELYELDYAYYSGQMQDLLALHRGTKLTSDMDGVIVGIKFMGPEESIQQDSAVIAVGDMDEKYIKCEYIARRDVIYYAEEIYAFVNGKRYEVTYVDDENTECSTFVLHDEKNEVSVGDYAKLVLIRTNSREQVLAVANEAIYVDTSGRYVYVMKDGAAVVTPVKTGISDGVYTEILSGLEEGDLIQMQTPAVGSDNVYVLEKGTFNKSFSRSGMLYYPETTYVRNTIENGTVCFLEYLVDEYQYVNEGDPIATIRVDGDKIALAQMEIDLKRDKERLADLIAENNEANEETIEQRQEAIAEQEEKLAQIHKDYATTTIYAPASGYVEGLRRYSAEAKLNANSIFAVISSVDVGYLQVEDMLGILSYGDVLDVSYTDRSRKNHEMQGTVVSLNNLGLSGSLEQEAVYLKLPDDGMQGLLEAMKDQSIRYTYNRLQVAGTVQEMNDVLLVPKDAVTEKDGVAYVNVMLDDGAVVPMSFIAGGSDSDYYWVIDGLTEGMKICWE